MFANRYTAFADACCLAGALKRNLLLTLAEAEFFRVRWSAEVLEETERAMAGFFASKGVADPAAVAKEQRRRMETAFEDALVSDYAAFLPAADRLPDPKDAHVIAAAVKTQAAVIVTDNLRDFPAEVLAPLGLEARSADAFIADTIALEPGRAVAAIRRMRERLKRPEKTPELLLLDMEAHGLMETVDVLRPYVSSL
ncbi:PIN domain-containing protein [Pedomonas mirosovicensis]|uniref:PIN domain-containing protein n=1 Tax=Pedomonas mirosovicensis TaxID=2908641 RepID=UPI00216A02B0|nr:PIN domain-containing protein [Pedomonas mirosovicensis]MCH8686282.1 PIN domain-containing protein [Pedomonas mirosovicensis]